MTEEHNSVSNSVVIIGGGVAGLEALLALRELARDRAAVTLVSAHDWFVDRPVTVAEPFGLGAAARHSLPEIASDLGADFVRATVASVDAAEHRIICTDGREIGFDTLILAPGATLSPPFDDAIAFGVEGSGRAIKEMISRLRSGEVRSVSFIAPSTTGWLLPLYELALMTAREIVRSNVGDVRLRLITPEEQPLALFGEHGSRTVAALLDVAEIEFVGATSATVGAGRVTLGPAGDSVAVDYVVTLPLLRGVALAGVPTRQPQNFIPIDEHGQVEGIADVYAAGDAVDYPVKQGGLAAQLADTVAEHIAARYGSDIEPAPFRPVLRGLLFTGGEPRFMRSDVPGSDAAVTDAWYALWWPPTKVAGRYLAPYLFGRSDEEGFAPHPEGFVDVDIPLAATTLPG